MNALRIIKPYRYEGQWVFDDERVNLVREPFVAGADAIIDHMTAGIENAGRGFKLLFSHRQFPGHDLALQRREPEDDGWWYYSEALDMRGWLCPALFLYYDQAPPNLYAQFSPLD